MSISSSLAIKASLIIMSTLISGLVMAMPAELSMLRPLGKGDMRWFGFRLYEATLLTPQGQPFDWARPFALQLRYARQISSQQLVQVSEEEMQRYGVPENRRLMWRQAMQKAFPDVQDGDVIIGSFDGRQTRFWYNGKPTEQIDDPVFGRQFFRIWLDAASRAPGLRRQLLNEPS